MPAAESYVPIVRSYVCTRKRWEGKEKEKKGEEEEERDREGKAMRFWF
jgi:hypothetical protein